MLPAVGAGHLGEASRTKNPAHLRHMFRWYGNVQIVMGACLLLQKRIDSPSAIDADVQAVLFGQRPDCENLLGVHTSIMLSEARLSIGGQSARSENKLTYGIYLAGISDEQKRSIIDQISLLG